MSRTVRVPLSKVLRYSAAAVSRQSLRSATRRLVHGPPSLHVWDGVAAAVLAVVGASSARGLEPFLFVTACAMLLLVRRLPLPVTTAIAALTVTGLNLVPTYGYVDGQVLDLSGGGALVGPSLVLLAAAGFLCASSAPLDWRLGIPLVPLLLAPQRSMLVLGLLLGLAVGAAWRSQASTRRAQARAEQLERVTETQRAEQIGLLERGELARELHDIVGHHVTAVVVLAEAAQARGTDADGDLGRIADTARAALGELDTLVTSLREPGTRAETSVHRGLVDLPDLLDPLHHAGVTTALHVAVRDEFGQGLQLTTYRIVQEALTNVMRHATARTVRIAVVQHPEALELSIGASGTRQDAPGHRTNQSDTPTDNPTSHSRPTGPCCPVTVGQTTTWRKAEPIGTNGRTPWAFTNCIEHD